MEETHTVYTTEPTTKGSIINMTEAFDKLTSSRVGDLFYWGDPVLSCISFIPTTWSTFLHLLLVYKELASYTSSSSSVLANLPLILGWLSASAFLQAYWSNANTNYNSNVSPGIKHVR